MPTQDRLPTGDSTISEWSPSSGTDDWPMVDDPVGSPNEDADYIQATGSGLDMVEMFTFPAFAAGSPVSSLTVQHRSRRSFGPNPITIRPMIRVNGINYEGNADTLGDGYLDMNFAWTTNPNTLAAWTQSDINGTGANPLQQFGLVAEDLVTGHIVRCTQIYATATWSDPAGQPMMLRATTVPRLRPWHPLFNR